MAPRANPSPGFPEFDGVWPSDLDLRSDDVAEAMNLDDMAGNGVFDAEGFKNLHKGSGVFEASFALPGYLARENPATGQSEVTDRLTGNPIESYAAGATSGATWMPSSQPRYLDVEPNGFIADDGRAWAARGQGNVPVQSTADMPDDFLGPVDQLPMGTTLATAPPDAARAALTAGRYPIGTPLSSAVPSLVRYQPGGSGLSGLGAVADDALSTVKAYAMPLSLAFLVGVMGCYAYRTYADR